MMPFCNKCGNELADDVKFCAACGAPTEQGAPPEPQEPRAQQAPPPQGDAFKNFVNTPDTTAAFDPNDIAQNKAMAILAYLGLLVLVPLFAAKESKFAQYHAGQGVTLCIFLVALWVVQWVLAAILYAISFRLGLALSSILSLVCGLASLGMILIGIINAANGSAKELPLIGKFKIIKL